MFTLRDSIVINAPIERCFDLSTHLSLVQKTLGMRTESSGFVKLDDRVRWSGWKFGWPTTHLSHISALQRPTFFQDTQEQGRFAFFQHDHSFLEVDGGTRLRDEVRFAPPFGAAGWIVGRFILEPHIRGLLQQRFALLKRIAESEEWRSFLA